MAIVRDMRVYSVMLEGLTVALLSACTISPPDPAPPPTNQSWLDQRTATERGGLWDPCADPVALGPDDCSTLVKQARGDGHGAAPVCLYDGIAQQCTFRCSELGDGGYMVSPRLAEFCDHLGGDCSYQSDGLAYCRPKGPPAPIVVVDCDGGDAGTE